MNTGLLDIRQDYIFKLVFSDENNKDVLIALLNAILKGEPHIYDITIQNPETPKLSANNRWMFLDIKAKIDDNQYVNIEIQAQNTIDLIDRGIQYLARMLVENDKRLQENKEITDSRWKYTYPKVIGIWILGSKLSHDYGAPVNEAVMTFKPNEMRSYQIVSDKIRLFTIELPKFNPKKRRHKDLLDDWMAFFNNPMDEEALENYEIHKALESLQYLSADKKVREEFDWRNDSLLYELSLANTSREEGEKIGEARGRAEGEKNAKIETARNLLNMNLSIDQISQATGLSIEEVDSLKQ